MACTATLARALPARACSSRLHGACWQGRRAFAAGFGQFPFGGNGFAQGPPPGAEDDRLYQLLGISRTADEAAIKQAYKKQAMKHHPDRGGDEAKFKDISRAYEVLSDPQKRQLYDAYGEEGLDGGGADAGPGGTNPFDLFSHIFGFQAGKQRRRGRPVTQDASYEVELTLEELYAGTSRRINYDRSVICKSCNGKHIQTCPRCKGRGTVQMTQQLAPGMVQSYHSVCSTCEGKGVVIIPEDLCRICNGKGTVKEKTPFEIQVEPGTEDGATFRFPGASDEEPGHDPGDLIIKVREKSHPHFQRVEDSLVLQKNVSLVEALCGFQFTVKFLDGEPLVIRGEPGKVLKPGDMLVLANKGMPNSKTRRAGNLFVQIQVDFPKEIPDESRRGLAELLGGALSEDGNGEVAKRLSQQQVQRIKEDWQRRAEQKEQRGQQQCVIS